jgi:hypothetical protein
MQPSTNEDENENVVEENDKEEVHVDGGVDSSGLRRTKEEGIKQKGGKKKNIALLEQYRTDPCPSTAKVERSLRGVVFGAFSVLSAMTLRDFFSNIFAHIASTDEIKKTQILGLYTFAILLITLFLVVVWE